ncbi:GNAT family N-acetyltransferase [Vibrio tritonius]|uniref:GNAT family N-acetyltransferase n=1 Tax=Vibrio tritonius TaxID=1435069 RepID=UPI00315C6A1A
MLIEQGSIDDILFIDALIPEFDGRNTRERLNERLSGIPHLILLAKIDGQIVGYKVGYQLSSLEFYSWIGGVIPSHRQQGVASELRRYQEQWARTSGYQFITVKSMNEYPNMLRLLIASGYQITDYEAGQTPTSGKIVFQRELV